MIHRLTRFATRNSLVLPRFVVRTTFSKLPCTNYSSAAFLQKLPLRTRLSSYSIPMRSMSYSSQDYYSMLGVSKSSTDAQIRRAYYEKAKKVHPDLNPDDPTAADRFKALAKAYSAIQTAEKRQEYDSMSAGHHRSSGRSRHKRQHQKSSHRQSQYQQSSAQEEEEKYAENLFKQVWEEFGLKEYIEHLNIVKGELSEAIDKSKVGDYSKAREFAQQRPGLILTVFLSTVAIFRFPAFTLLIISSVLTRTIHTLSSLPAGVSSRLLGLVWLGLRAGILKFFK